MNWNKKYFDENGKEITLRQILNDNGFKPEDFIGWSAGTHYVSLFPMKLKALRERAGVSVRKLSTLSGISHSHISKIENGKIKHPNQETMKKLMNALGYEIKFETYFDLKYMFTKRIL